MTTWLFAVGTPWALDDAYHTLKNTGQYIFVNIPAMKRVSEGEGVYCDGVNRNGVIFDDIVGWWELTDPKNYRVVSAIKDRADGKAAFWQMIMLDLATAKHGGLRYYIFPKDKIDNTWPFHGGCDPAYTFKESREEAKKNSAFALAYVGKKPAGGAVIKDGVLDKCSVQKACTYIAAAQSLFMNWVFTATENVGIGRLFIEAARLINPGLTIIGSDLGGIMRQKGEPKGKTKSKSDRILYELAPWFENATVMISDEETQFNMALRMLLDNFYEMDDRTADEAWDAGDAVYHAVKSMPEVLQINPLLAEEMAIPRPQAKHPLAGLKDRGYGQNYY